MRSSISKLLMLITISVCTIFTQVYAQNGTISGKITDQQQQALAGVTIHLAKTSYAAISDDKGHFQLTAPAGAYLLKATSVGYQSATQSISISADKTTELFIILKSQPQQLAGVEVSALPPDLQPLTHLSANKVREANVRDAGELMRNLQGVDAVRRGPLGLDPSIRGLRESEVGFYVNGTRMFPAGPARMDSPLDHYDPDDVKSIEIVKGPYALTWGPGNLSAVKMTLKDAPPPSETGLLHGELSGGYNTNFNSANTGLSLFGRKNKIGYRLDANWRDGGNYTSGNGTVVPAHFHSQEMRGQLAYNFTGNSSLKVGGGLQYQHDIDYPGRLLNAKYFHTYDVNADYVLNRPNKLLRKVEVQAYYNHIKHQMNNDGKPTAYPDSTRMPPFPLSIILNANSHTSGGKAAFTLIPDKKWELEFGGNFYSNYRKAVREVDRRDIDKHLFTDLAWPGATVTMGGIYAHAGYHFHDIYILSATLRGDEMANSADTASDFFKEKVSTDLKAQHSSLSSALSLTVTPLQHWNFSLGLGTVARSADASELYSDRFPSSKAQTSAEFMGNPQLQPERTYQSDLWIEALYPKFSFSANVFARRLQNYITLMPTDLPKRLPLSPNTVYAYRNGKADFYGFEITAAYRIITQLTLSNGLSYLWGKDLTQNEPALGITPFRTDTHLRYELANKCFFLQAGLHTADRQDRVATSRGETATKGYYTIDMTGGVNITSKISLQLGVENLTNQQYTNHLNSKNPFTGVAVPEPGRVFFANAHLRF